MQQVSQRVNGFVLLGGVQGAVAACQGRVWLAALGVAHDEPPRDRFSTGNVGLPH
jgi:hypothetical protein